MSTEPNKKETPEPTEGRYSSMEEFMTASGVSQETQKDIQRQARESKLVSALAVARSKSGTTQAQMAEHLGCTQSAISKLESGVDGDLTLSQVREYSKITKCSFGIWVGKPLNHVAAINLHAQGIYERLQALCSIAHQDTELEVEIQKFYNKALMNLMNIIAECQSDMPNCEDVEFRLQISGLPGGKHRLSTPQGSESPISAPRRRVRKTQLSEH